MGTEDTSYKSVGGRLTKFAAIPEPPADVSPGTKRFLAALKETVEVREGKRGSSLDRSIVVRDLLDPAFTAKYWPGGGTGNPNTSPTPGQRDTTPPAAVSGLAIDTTEDDNNTLTWTNPTDSDLSHVQIYAAYIYPGIPPWGSGMNPSINDLARYGDYVYKFVVSGGGVGVSPVDPIHGYNGNSTRYWQRQLYPYRRVSGAYLIGAITKPTATFVHNLNTAEDLGSDWYYWARAVDYTMNKSNWSPSSLDEGLFALAKTTSAVIPTPTGLSIRETGSTTEFNDVDINLCWNPSTNPMVVDYEVEVLVAGSRRRLQTGIRGCAWTYAYALNKLDGGGTPEKNLTFKLWAVDPYGNRSESYNTITVTNPAPAAVSGLTATGIMGGVRFRWNPSDATDLLRYEYSIKVGGTGTYSAWEQTSLTQVDSFLTSAENTAYEGVVVIYIKVRCVDTWENVSAEVRADAYSLSFIVKPHNIDDFAIKASKIWLNLPILEGDVWHANTPFAGSVKWNNHSLYHNGVKYIITAAYTNRKYIYWKSPNTVYSTSDTNPSPETLGHNGWVIAVNIGGSYDLAWNAIANQVIGSAYIEDASIETAHIKNLSVNNAKIYGDLDASKIITGLLQSSNWSTTVGSELNMDNGTFKLGGSSNPKLHYDGSTLTIRGAIMQSLAGVEFPVPIYRGVYSSTVYYYKGDMVTYGGSSWVYTYSSAGRGYTPSVTSSRWDLWAAAGATGPAGADGATGDPGPGVVYCGEFVAGTYYYGTTLRRDVVKYGGSYYICNASHTAASWVAAYWNSFGATFSSVATDLLLANDVTILRSLVLGQEGSQYGVIRSGKNSYGDDANPGLWLGWYHSVSGDSVGVNIGGPNGNVKWDGSRLTVSGNDVLNESALPYLEVGSYVVAQSNSRADTRHSSLGYQLIKSIRMPRGGIVHVKWKVVVVGGYVYSRLYTGGRLVVSNTTAPPGDTEWAYNVEFDAGDLFELKAYHSSTSQCWIEDFQILAKYLIGPAVEYEGVVFAT